MGSKASFRIRGQNQAAKAGQAELTDMKRETRIFRDWSQGLGKVGLDWKLNGQKRVSGWVLNRS
jgi:hypothetical protein